MISDTMIPTAVLAQAGANVTWVSVLSMIGQWIEAIGTVTVAIVAFRWNRRGQRDQEAARETAQATLVTIEVDYFSMPHSDHTASVKITNLGEQAVRWPEVESMGTPSHRVRWGNDVHLYDEEGERYWTSSMSTPPLLLPHKSHPVLF
ncbi:MAG: hypothetical protein ABIZ05_05085 [Pseudonocardiaceae bacterium]